MSTAIQVAPQVSVNISSMRTSHMLVQGASGAGKSYLLRVFIEMLFPHIPIIVIDPEGDFHTLREKFPFVLVGENGETPARVDTAALLARRLTEIGASAICDLYALEREEQEEWVGHFLKSMISLPKHLWRPMLVIIDEAHIFAPEKGDGSAICGKTVEDFSSRCRKHGIGLICATQRITKLSNNVCGNLQNYLVGRTFLQGDLERVSKALGVPKRKAEMEAFSKELKMLQPGQFYALGAAVSFERVLFSAPRALTTHPEPGSLQGSKLPTPDDIKALLPQLKDLPKEVEAAQDEVEQLKSRVVELENECIRLEMLATEQSSQPQAAVETVDREKLKAAMHDEVQQIIRNTIQPQIDRAIGTELDHLTEDLESRLEMVKKFRTVLRNPHGAGWDVFMLSDGAKAAIEGAITVQGAGQEIELGVPTPAKINGQPGRVAFFNKDAAEAHGYQVKSQQPINGHSAPKLTGAAAELSKGGRAVLEELSVFHPKYVSKKRIAAIVGTSAKKSTWRAYMAELRPLGLIEETDSEMRLSAEGLKAIGGAVRRPRSTDEVLAKWLPKLSSGSWRLLQFVVTHKGRPVPREVVGSHIDTDPKSSTFRAYMAELRSADLVIATKDSVAANKEALLL